MVAAVVAHVLKRTWFKPGTRFEQTWDFYEKQGYGGLYSRDPRPAFRLTFLQIFWLASRLRPQRLPYAFLSSVTTLAPKAGRRSETKKVKPYERTPRRPWVTDHTLNLLEQAERAEAAQDGDAKHRSRTEALR